MNLDEALKIDFTERAKAASELRQMLTEENQDTWDWERSDNVRDVILSGSRVMPSEEHTAEYAGGNWEWYDREKANAEGWAGPGGKRAKKIARLLRQLSGDELTELALGLSLCPLHLLDYAICFDDGDPECAAIRLVHPGHDT